MNRILLLAAFFITALSACNNHTREAENAPLPENFYKRLDGKIGDEQVVVHLHKTGNEYFGVYYADSAWLTLRLDTLTGKDSVILFEDAYNDYYWDKKDQARLALKWTGDGFSGTRKLGGATVDVTLKENYPQGAHKFSILHSTDSLAAFEGKPGSPKARFSFTFPRPEGAALSSLLVNAAFEKATTWENGAATVKSNFFKDYTKDTRGEVYYNADSVGGGFLSYSNNTNGFIYYNDKDFLVVDHFRDSYTGGAHGYYFSTLVNLDVKSNKVLKLSDIITADSLSLQKIIESNFRKQYNVKPGEGLDKVLFDKHLPAGKNFYFNNNGIAFIYNPYDVASYAQGQITVFIPYSELKRYLKESFAKRML